MDITQISGLIGTLGFPVVACGFLIWFVTTKFIKALQDVTGALEKNSMVMQLVIEKTGIKIDELNKGA